MKTNQVPQVTCNLNIAKDMLVLWAGSFEDLLGSTNFDRVLFSFMLLMDNATDFFRLNWNVFELVCFSKAMIIFEKHTLASKSQIEFEVVWLPILLSMTKMRMDCNLK